MKLGQVAGLVVALILVTGCGKGGGASDAAGGNSEKKTTEGSKIYTPDTKPGKAGKAASSGSQPLPSPADTINGKPSADSDNGGPGSTKGQPVLNPGAPSEKPQR